MTPSVNPKGAEGNAVPTRYMLIVEDGASATDLIRDSMSRCGLEVRTVNGVEDAIRVFKQLQPVIVLVDLERAGGGRLRPHQTATI